MALGKAWSVAVAGIDGHVVEIEADIGGGLPGVKMVGLPDTALQESRDRVRAAVSNSGGKWPDSKVVLALSPATLPKVGSVYDLALACAVLNAADVVPLEAMTKTILLGELALDGRLRPIRGVLPAVVTAKKNGWSRVVVPTAMMTEASLVAGIDVYGADTLREVVLWLQGDGPLDRPDLQAVPPRTLRSDLSEVVGQHEARRAIEVAAAGAHHLMLTGPPGIGKTMLAQRLPGILPELSETHALEVTAVHSVAGTLTRTAPSSWNRRSSRRITPRRWPRSSVGAQVWQHRGRSAVRIEGCCSSTRSPRWERRLWRHYERPSKTGKCASPAETA